MAVSPGSHRIAVATGALAGVGSADGVTAGAQAGTASRVSSRGIPGHGMARIAEAPEERAAGAAGGIAQREGDGWTADPPAAAPVQAGVICDLVRWVGIPVGSRIRMG